MGCGSAKTLQNPTSSSVQHDHPVAGPSWASQRASKVCPSKDSIESRFYGTPSGKGTPIESGFIGSMGCISTRVQGGQTKRAVDTAQSSSNDNPYHEVRIQHNKIRPSSSSYECASSKQYPDENFRVRTCINATSRIRVTLSSDGSMLQVETEKLDTDPCGGFQHKPVAEDHIGARDSDDYVYLSQGPGVSGLHESAYKGRGVSCQWQSTSSLSSSDSTRPGSLTAVDPRSLETSKNSNRSKQQDRKRVKRSTVKMLAQSKNVVRTSPSVEGVSTHQDNFKVQYPNTLNTVNACDPSRAKSSTPRERNNHPRQTSNRETDNSHRVTGQQVHTGNRLSGDNAGDKQNLYAPASAFIHQNCAIVHGPIPSVSPDKLRSFFEKHNCKSAWNSECSCSTDHTTCVEGSSVQSDQDRSSVGDSRSTSKQCHESRETKHKRSKFWHRSCRSVEQKSTATEDKKVGIVKSHDQCVSLDSAELDSGRTADNSVRTHKGRNNLVKGRPISAFNSNDLRHVHSCECPTAKNSNDPCMNELHNHITSDDCNDLATCVGCSSGSSAASARSKHGSRGMPPTPTVQMIVASPEEYYASGRLPGDVACDSLGCDTGRITPSEDIIVVHEAEDKDRLPAIALAFVHRDFHNGKA